MTAFIAAAAQAESIEARHTQLSEAQAQGLLEWCLHGSTGSSESAGSTGTTSGVKVSCVHCGKPAVVPMMQPGYENLGDPLDSWWLCAQHRSAMQAITGSPSSPGRPEDPPHEQYVKRLRGLSHRLSAARSQQPSAPRMPRPGSSRPTAPSMPRHGSG